MEQKTRFMAPVKHTLVNLKKMFVLSWQTDKNIVIGYYFTAGLAALFSLAISFVLKYLIDALIANGGLGVNASIPAILLVLLGTRYILGVARTLTHWGLNQTYFDYLLRYKLQNRITFLFYQKLASLDISSLEDPKTQDLIAKAKDTMAWRLPDFMRTFSYFFTDLISYISSFIVLLSFGWWIPLIITAINLPYLYIRAKFDVENYLKVLHEVAGTFTIKNHPEWATKAKIIKWVNESRKQSERNFDVPENFQFP